MELEELELEKKEVDKDYSSLSEVKKATFQNFIEMLLLIYGNNSAEDECR